MSHSAAQPENQTTGQAAPGLEPGGSVRCPLPASPQKFTAGPGDMCTLWGVGGCPLIPPVRGGWASGPLWGELPAPSVSVPASQVDSQIESALRRLVAFLGVDRGGLAE